MIDSHQRKPCDTYSCPICQVDLLPFPKLQKNFQLCRIVEKFLAPFPRRAAWRRRSQQPGKRKVSPCDFCLGQPQPAVRTCLTCEASFCQAHLRKQCKDCPERPCPNAHVLVPAVPQREGNVPGMAGCYIGTARMTWPVSVRCATLLTTTRATASPPEKRPLTKGW